MSIATTRPEVPLQVITQKDVHASIKRAKRNLWSAAEEIVWQIEMEGWRTLGYPSWNAMRDAEYGGIAFMVPRQSRPELLERMRRAGLTQQEIADTAGIGQSTVQRDLNTQMGNEDSTLVTNSRGQQRPATYTRHEREDDVVDAEVVEDDEPDYVTDQEALEATTDPTPVESAISTVSCPTCHGTGKVTR